MLKNAIIELVKKIYSDFGKEYEGQCESEIETLVYGIENTIDHQIRYFGRQD